MTKIVNENQFNNQFEIVSAGLVPFINGTNPADTISNWLLN